MNDTFTHQYALDTSKVVKLHVDARTVCTDNGAVLAVFHSVAELKAVQGEEREEEMIIIIKMKMKRG